MPRLLDPELHGWPIDAAARRAIVERRISMLGRTDWTGYPAGVPKLGRLGSTVTLFIVIPILCVVTLLILVLAGSPNAAYAFGLTFLAEGAIFAVIYRDRRRNLTRAAALETGHPVCLFCGYYNLGHHTQDSVACFRAFRTVCPGSVGDAVSCREPSRPPRQPGIVRSGAPA